MGRRSAKLLWCAATDSTFERARLGEREVLAGKCIHCKRKLAVDLTGQPIANETVEHIVPRTHGGTDAVENLAIACSRCNQGKGSRLDHRPWSDPTLQAVISTLRARRRARMRPPLAGLELPPLSPPDQDTAPADSAQRGRGTKSRGRRGR